MLIKPFELYIGGPAGWGLILGEVVCGKRVFCLLHLYRHPGWDPGRGAHWDLIVLGRGILPRRQRLGRLAAE